MGRWQEKTENGVRDLKDVNGIKALLKNLYQKLSLGEVDSNFPEVSNDGNVIYSAKVVSKDVNSYVKEVHLDRDLKALFPAIAISKIESEEYGHALKYHSEGYTNEFFRIEINSRDIPEDFRRGFDSGFCDYRSLHSVRFPLLKVFNRLESIRENQQGQNSDNLISR